MLRVDNNIIVNKTRRDSALDLLRNSSADKYNLERDNILYKLVEAEKNFIPKYNYETVLTCNEYFNGIEIIGKTSHILEDFIKNINFNKVGYGMRSILYKGISVSVPQSYIEPIKSIVDRFDRLYSTTDYGMDETTVDEFIDLTINSYKYEDIPYRKWLYYFMYTINYEGSISVDSLPDDSKSILINCNTSKFNLLFSRLPKHTEGPYILFRGDGIETKIEYSDTIMDFVRELHLVCSAFDSNKITSREKILLSDFYKSLSEGIECFHIREIERILKFKYCNTTKVIIGSEVIDLPIFMLSLILKDGDIAW